MDGKRVKPMYTGIVNKFLFPEGALTDKYKTTTSSIKPIRFGLYSLVRLLNTYYTEAKRSFAIVVNDKDTLNCMDWFTAPKIYKNLENYKNSGRYTETYNRAILADRYWSKVAFRKSMYEKDGMYEIPNTLSPYPFICLDVKEGLVGEEYKEIYYEGEWKIQFMYPKSDIAKLTSFKVVSGLVKF